MRRLAAIAVLILAGCSTGAAPTPITVYVTPAPVIIATPRPAATPDTSALFGVVEFGTGYTDALDITGKKASFKRTVNEIAYVAHLSDSVNASTVTFVLSSRTSAGSEKVLVKTDIDVADPDSDTFANKVDLAYFADNKAGTYVVRFLRGGTKLAEGTFTLTK